MYKTSCAPIKTSHEYLFDESKSNFDDFKNCCVSLVG